MNTPTHFTVDAPSFQPLQLHHHAISPSITPSSPDSASGSPVSVVSRSSSTSTSRSSSRKRPPRSGGVDPGNSKPELYKTELCRAYAETGSCRYGSKCQFAHGVSELRPVARHPLYKTEYCRMYHTVGTCCYGSRCKFIHESPDEAENPLRLGQQQRHNRKSQPLPLPQHHQLQHQQTVMQKRYSLQGYFTTAAHEDSTSIEDTSDSFEDVLDFGSGSTAQTAQQDRSIDEMDVPGVTRAVLEDFLPLQETSSTTSEQVSSPPPVLPQLPVSPIKYSPSEFIDNPGSIMMDPLPQDSGSFVSFW